MVGVGASLSWDPGVVAVRGGQECAGKAGEDLRLVQGTRGLEQQACTLMWRCGRTWKLPSCRSPRRGRQLQGAGSVVCMRVLYVRAITLFMGARDPPLLGAVLHA